MPRDVKGVEVPRRLVAAQHERDVVQGGPAI